MHSIELNIINKTGSLNQWTQSIEDTIIETLDRIDAVIELSDLSLTVIDKPEQVIPETGLNGFAGNAHEIEIFLDSHYPKLSHAIRYELPRTLAHEVHHALRWRGPGYGDTLFEAMISEGLADHFDMEINQGDPRPWNLALTASQQRELFARAQAFYLDSFYEHGAWFFGAKEQGIPRWTGYTLGFIVVSRYLQEHLDQSATSLTYEPAHLFIGSIPR